MTENRIRRHLRKIRESYRMAVNDWVNYDMALMVNHLEQSVSRTIKLINHIKKEFLDV